MGWDYTVSSTFVTQNFLAFRDHLKTQGLLYGLGPKDLKNLGATTWSLKIVSNSTSSYSYISVPMLFFDPYFWLVWLLDYN